MTAFTEDEQWDSDLDWFAIDRDGKIGHFTSVGWRLLPPSIASSKENLGKIFDYFDQMEIKNGYLVCPNLQTHLAKLSIDTFDKYVRSFAEMSSRGLYSYDSYDYSHDNRPYFRVTIPKSELRLDDLPQDIKDILENLGMNEISFAEDSVIPEELTNKL
jgi:hypothetical protein